MGSRLQRGNPVLLLELLGLNVHRAEIRHCGCHQSHRGLLEVTQDSLRHLLGRADALHLHPRRRIEVSRPADEDHSSPAAAAASASAYPIFPEDRLLR